MLTMKTPDWECGLTRVVERCGDAKMIIPRKPLLFGGFEPFQPSIRYDARGWRLTDIKLDAHWNGTQDVGSKKIGNETVSCSEIAVRDCEGPTLPDCGRICPGGVGRSGEPSRTTS